MKFSRINLLTSLKHILKCVTSNFADYFNKCSLELLLILLAFKLVFHSFIMVIGGGERRKEARKKKYILHRNNKQLVPQNT